MKNGKFILRGEAALLLAIIINSIGGLLMLQSGSGISAISSFPSYRQICFRDICLKSSISHMQE